MFSRNFAEFGTGNKYAIFWLGSGSRTYIRTICSAPFTIKTRPMVHFIASTKVKQLIKNSAN